MAKKRPFQVPVEDQHGQAVTQLACRVPKQVYKSIKLWAVDNDVSVSDLVGEALRDLMTKRKIPYRNKQSKAA